jgi:hypothetical protein
MSFISNTNNIGLNKFVDPNVSGKSSVGEVSDDTRSTGTGNLTTGTVVPDAKIRQETLNTYVIVMESIAVLMSNSAGGEEQKILLASLIAKLKKTQDKNAIDEIHSNTEAQKAEIEKQKAKFDEAARKISEASHHDGGPFGWIKAAFQALAATIAIGVGTLMLATGVGAPLGALMIAAGVVGLIMAVDSMVKLGSKEGTGIMGSIVLAITNDKEAAAKADMGFGIGMAVIGVALAVAMFMVPGGQAMAAENVMMAAQTMQRLQATAQNVATIVNAASVVGGSAAGIAESVENFKAAELQSAALLLKADAKDIQGIIAQLDDMITQLLSQMQQMATKMNACLDAVTEAIQDEGKTYGASKLAG